MKMKEILKSGKIVKSIRSDGIRYNYFPKSKRQFVSHVRPHGKDKNDEFLLPVPDKVTGKKKYTKQCFWLHKEFIKRICLS